MYRGAGGKGRRIAQVHVSLAGSTEAALENAWRWWPNGAIPAALLSELARPKDFEAVAESLPPETMNETVVCAVDGAPIVHAIDRYVGAGFDTVYLHQIGPDQQRLADVARTGAAAALPTRIVTAAAATHRPPLGSHRLLGHGVGAALVRIDGEVDWWCPDRFEATPLLWSLLDRDGGCSRWRDAAAAAWDGCPAGPTATTTVRVGEHRVELWDGLVACGAGSC